MQILEGRGRGWGEGWKKSAKNTQKMCKAKKCEKMQKHHVLRILCIWPWLVGLRIFCTCFCFQDNPQGREWERR